MIKVAVTILTVLAVLVLRALLKLALLPFRVVRGLWRRMAWT